jgi:hypothetical protein
MRLFEQTGTDEIARFLDAEQLLVHPLGRHSRGADDDERRVGPQAPAV